MGFELQQSSSRVYATVHYTVQPTIVIIILWLRLHQSQSHKWGWPQSWHVVRMWNSIHMTAMGSRQGNKFESTNSTLHQLSSRLDALKTLLKRWRQQFTPGAERVSTSLGEISPSHTPRGKGQTSRKQQVPRDRGRQHGWWWQTYFKYWPMASKGNDTSHFEGEMQYRAEC